MSLVKAPALGIERFANGQNKEHWKQASDSDNSTIIRAVYQQVLGGQHVMKSDRLEGSESLFRNGYLNVREFVRLVAKSAQYRARFFESCNPYRFIELNHKHLLGRAPHNKEEMLHHFTILQEQGYDAEIDSYIDSAEYNRNFGNDRVPHMHGWGYSIGHEGRQFSYLMQLARGAAASVKGDRNGTQFKLGQALHQNRPIPVSGAAGAVVVPSTPIRTPSAAQYAHISTDGPFSAAVSSGSDLPSGDLPSTRRIDGTPAYGFRSNELLVSAPNAGAADGSRVVTITATGIANNRFIRHGAYTTRVPYSRMNEALQRILRQGGRVVSVVVSGDGNTAAPAPAAEAPAQEEKPKAKGRGRSKG